MRENISFSPQKTKITSTGNNHKEKNLCHDEEFLYSQNPNKVSYLNSEIV